jgi:UDP-N-acetylmuramate dehydrogenase
MTIEENAPLAELTTFRLGGPARFLARVRSVEELQEALAFAREMNLRTLVLGGGSNMLVDDAGFDGLVIKNEISGIERTGDTLIAGAGECWDSVVARAVEEGLWGLENLSGIPGSVGGAVVQGIGAYGAAVGERLAWVEAWDSETGQVRRMTNPECAFDYRDSFFKHDNGRHMVLNAAFELSSAASPNLSYRDVAQRMTDAEPTLEGLRTAILRIREGKFPDLAQEGTAGSFFKNPILPAAEARALQTIYPEMPLFAMPETTGVKVPLAWLLDKVLQVKGMNVGGARLFERQPLVIAASRDASAADVIELKEKIKTLAKEKLDLEIEEEVSIIS